MDEIKTGNNPDTKINQEKNDDHLELMKELGMAGSISALQGWKQGWKRKTYLELESWVFGLCKCEKNIPHFGLIDRILNGESHQSSNETRRHGQHKHWHLTHHAFELSEYPLIIPMGVALKVKEAMNLGFEKEKFYILDPELAKIGDPMLIYRVGPDSWQGWCGEFDVLMEWDKVR